MKTPLQELIEWLKEYRLNTMSLMGIHDYEQGQIDVLSDVIKRATELLEKERAEILNAYFEGKMDSVRENRGHMIAELYFKERYNQNK